MINLIRFAINILLIPISSVIYSLGKITNSEESERKIAKIEEQLTKL